MSTMPQQMPEQMPGQIPQQMPGQMPVQTGPTPSYILNSKPFGRSNDSEPVTIATPLPLFSEQPLAPNGGMLIGPSKVTPPTPANNNTFYILVFSLLIFIGAVVIIKFKKKSIVTSFGKVKRFLQK